MNRVEHLSNFFDKRAKPIALLILSLLLVYFLTKGFMLSSDSPDYIQNALIRSPLYPLFLNGIELIFGKGNFYLVPLIQLLFGFSASFWLANFLRNTYKLPGILFLVILFLLLTPYSFYFGNLILSEGLAYPLFLLSIRFLFTSLLQDRKRHTTFFYFLIFLSLLILTRRQYLFLYVVAFVAVVYFIFFLRSPWLKKLSLFLALLASILFTDLMERAYHYHYNGHFSTVPFVHFQLMAMPLYLSSDKNIDLYSDPKEKAILQDAKKIMKEKHYDTSSIWKENEHPEYYHYYMNYNNVTWGSLSEALSKNNVQGWMEREAILKHMYPPLLKAQWQRVVSLYLRNIVNSLGGYYNFILLWVVLFMCCYFHFLKRDKLSLGLFFAIFISFGNYFLVALVEPAMTRYTFSTNIILISLFITAFYYALRNYTFVDQSSGNLKLK